MRIRGLDFLRGIAIIGVLFRHSEMQNRFSLAGGFGVDLFFVLSGFLVAGLLFKEYKKNGTANVGRFLVRRGFKIYPAFYICLATTVILDIFYFHNPPPVSNIITEAIFWQSYSVPVRFHTWSLSVEEHFYFILAFLVFLAVRFNRLNNFKTMLISIMGLISVIFVMRFVFCFRHYQNPVPFFGTHLRSDGLFTGVLFAYLWHFGNDYIKKWQQYRMQLYLLAVILIAPVFFLTPDSFFMFTIGFNCMHVGFAIFILLFADENREPFMLRNPFIKPISLLICFVGVHSYSIYLWHLVVKDVFCENLKSPMISSIVFFASAIGIGVLSSWVIEKQFMKIADRYFPRLT